MSRIGKMPVVIPDGVDVNLDGSTLTVKGKGGELTQTFSDILTIKIEEGTIIVERPDDEIKSRSLHGLTRSLINNMVTGVSAGYKKELELVGVGYRAQLKGKDLELALGYSHPVLVKCPDGITFECPENTKIIVSGIDKQKVGQIAADIRKHRPPEPYKGKGIRYSDEYVRRKEGKTAA
ncbi:MAG: 50S ribosomal protein L6 [Coriobacteriales bacterium]|nr:50S ribosomal protein L6 [Coriobacteriales bacterium]